MPRIVTGFDEALWRAGVEDGAFSGTKDKSADWYALEAGSVKVALASAAPGPGDLTTVSYYVVPAFRNHGYGAKLARYIADRHEKASFLVKKDNEASVKVALAALRGKFAATVGRHVVRLTKEAGIGNWAKGVLGRMAERRLLRRQAEAAEKSFLKRLRRHEAEGKLGLSGRKTAAPLSGGLAEKEDKKPSDFDPKKLEEGRKVEMEHTDDPAMAKRIAMDHLTEDENYYKKLKKIEKKAIEAKKGDKKAGPVFGPYMHLIDDAAILARGVLRKQAIDIFGHPLGYLAGGMAGEMTLGRKFPVAAPIGGAILGGQIAKHKFAPKPKEASMKTADAVQALREYIKPMLRKGPWLKAPEKKPMGREALLESLITDAQASGAGK